MKKRFTLVSVLASTALIACGGGEPAQTSNSAGSAGVTAAPPPAMGEMTMPSWFQVDNDARTVSMTITAGSTTENNSWNFNGVTKGAMTITVPEGYTVTVELVNNDPVMAHSLGISTETSSFSGAPEPVPAFPGAITSNPASMMESTMPGQRESIQFTVDQAGNYSMVCYIAGHALTGMWVYFNVSADGLVGV
ncbi:MAG: sulfocyanin-like copper-binding protein, partial [Longimicrobiales bacterium]|nr:sulfocyanin-like copper-binding protein [Longimicrobiales bacterium]